MTRRVSESQAGMRGMSCCLCRGGAGLGGPSQATRVRQRRRPAAVAAWGQPRSGVESAGDHFFLALPLAPPEAAALRLAPAPTTGAASSLSQGASHSGAAAALGSPSLSRNRE